MIRLGICVAACGGAYAGIQFAELSQLALTWICVGVVGVLAFAVTD